MYVQVPDVSLRCLIEEVRAQEKSGRVSKHTLLDLATCYLSNQPYSKQDGAEASIIAAKYGLNKFLDRRRRIRSYNLIQRERGLSYEFKCCICGRALGRAESIERGMGDVCYSKFLTERAEDEARLRTKLKQLEPQMNKYVAEVNGGRLAPPPGTLPSHTGGEKTVEKLGMLRQGEVLLQKIKVLPPGLVAKDKVLAHGEATGHSHRLVGQCQVLTDGKTQFVITEAESILQHEEHKTVTVPPGLFKVTIQREYDIVRDEVRAVSD